jgi:hypothetical protein
MRCSRSGPPDTLLRAGALRRAPVPCTDAQQVCAVASASRYARVGRSEGFHMVARGVTALARVTAVLALVAPVCAAGGAGLVARVRVNGQPEPTSSSGRSASRTRAARTA